MRNSTYVLSILKHTSILGETIENITKQYRKKEQYRFDDRSVYAENVEIKDTWWLTQKVI